MQKPERKLSGIDSINVLLEECIMAYPISSFVISLYKQYGLRGSLSKKQLQGLYDKALKIEGLAPGKLAAVEVIIKKMPTRNKLPLPTAKPMYEKDEEISQMIKQILIAFPEHKRLLFLQSKFENNQPLSTNEIDDIKRIVRLVRNKG